MVNYVIPEYNNISFFEVGKGKMFGEIDAIFDNHRVFKAIAAEDVEVITVKTEIFKQIFFNEFAKIGKQLMKNSEEKRLLQVKNYLMMKTKFERINFNFKQATAMVEDRVNNMFVDSHVIFKKIYQ